MELKDYQTRALIAFEGWVKTLSEAEQDASEDVERRIQRGRPVLDEHRNYPKHAWELMAESGVLPYARDYVPREDGVGRPVPHVCFKVPTGGGKTLLAASAIGRLKRPRGLVLWVMPTRAIYDQTKASLWNKTHPYRQTLEWASGGHVKMLEKDDGFSPEDVSNSLCVMLLMLPAANRQKEREFLLMNRNASRYRAFFPDRDDQPGNEALLEEHPDLDVDEDTGVVIHSLFNVLKTSRPVVVLDEAHKAYGKGDNDHQYARSISSFDPSLVIELSATPNSRISNILVDIEGTELRAEEMIKSPVQVTPVPAEIDWRDVLREAHAELEKLTDEAEDLEMSEGRYIRPIAVVRVERTGKTQRDNIRVHTEDVRDYLIQDLAVPDYAIRVKSSETDELGRENLLSKDSQVRWIITKDALREGWDCSFAYMLVLLDKTQAPTAITQLVGRVMRQPEASLTNRELLDQCYVYCWTNKTHLALQQVKNGLEHEGLTGLGDDVIGRRGASDIQRREVNRKAQFADTDIFLPKVLHKSGDDWEELDYEEHILPSIDWNSLRLPESDALIAPKQEVQTVALDVDGSQTISHGPRELPVDKTVTLSYFARQLAEIVPNPWLVSRMANRLVERMTSEGRSDEYVYERRSIMASNLRDRVIKQVEKMAEQVFLNKRDSGIIRFDLESVESSYEMPKRYQISLAKQDRPLQKAFGEPLNRSLFDWLRESEFNTLERDCAYCLDDYAAIRWWHRITSRQKSEYYLRGWLPQRIFPDFIAMAGDSSGKPQLLVFESKGPQYKGSEDTEYKKKVLNILEETFNAGKTTVRMGPTRGAFRLVFDKSEILAALQSG